MAEKTRREESVEELEERTLEAELRMEKSLESLEKELLTIRSGRASPALLDRVHVDVYGTQQLLPHVATVNAPEPRLLVIKPHDPGTLAAIERALTQAQLGLNPSNDGIVIRIAVPPLTEERRHDFVKIVRGKAEEARVSIRNIRRDVIEHLRRVEKEGHISKDEVEGRVDDLQKLTDKFIGRVDDTSQRKETELLEI